MNDPLVSSALSLSVLPLTLLAAQLQPATGWQVLPLGGTVGYLLFFAALAALATVASYRVFARDPKDDLRRS